MLQHIWQTSHIIAKGKVNIEPSTCHSRRYQEAQGSNWAISAARDRSSPDPKAQSLIDETWLHKPAGGTGDQNCQVAWQMARMFILDYRRYCDDNLDL
jgi:hypothetical protein